MLIGVNESLSCMMNPNTNDIDPGYCRLLPLSAHTVISILYKYLAGLLLIFIGTFHTKIKSL